MKTLISHGRKDQIVINIHIDDFAREYFKIFKKRLTRSYIYNQKIEQNKLTFNGSIFRYAWNGWDLFNTVSQGEIEFTTENDNPFIRHKIVFSEIIATVLIFNLIPLFALKFEPRWSLFIFLGIWIFYGINYFVTVFRFNSFVAKILIEVNKTAGYEFKVEEKGIG